MDAKVIRRYVSCISIALAALCAATASAATKAEKSRAAEQCVAEALHREIYGLNAERNALLRTALNHSHTCTAARWHSGRVQHHGKWVTVDEVAEAAASDRRLLRYESRRTESPDTVAGHLELARWCQDNGLSDQARAHLTRVLQLDTDHQEARRRLGFVRVGDVWLTRDEVRAARDRAADAAVAMAHWKPKLEQLRDRLLDGSRKQREFAAERVQAVQSINAIPALEAVLSTAGENPALLVVETLKGIGGSEAAISLARHAVFSDHASVRQQAAEALRDRTMDDYVPALLSAMQLPLQTQREVLQGPRGRLLYRHSFYREGQEDRDIAVLETSYRRVKMPGGSRRDTLERATDDIRQRAQQREDEVAIENQRTNELNERITTTLEIATDQKKQAAPRVWWQWWNDHNEVYVAGEKPLRETRDREEIEIVDASPLLDALALTSGPGNSGPGIPSGPVPTTMDCLAAGTTVWTETGPRSIESIRVGDRVLSQDPETAELAFKPVLATTLRPASQLTRIAIDDESFQSSGGHLFWVAGDGWTRSRDMKGGEALHGADGAATISFVEKGSTLPTYNLIVADFHTYFVGKARILSHDNTVRRPTRKTVPGLAAD